VPLLVGPRQNIAIPFGVKKLEWWGYPTVKIFWGYVNRLDAIPACDRQTDGRTDILRRHSPRYAYASRGNNMVAAAGMLSLSTAGPVIYNYLRFSAVIFNFEPMVISDTTENSHIHFFNPKNVRIDPNIVQTWATLATSQVLPVSHSYVEFQYKESVSVEEGWHEDRRKFTPKTWR